VETATTYHAAAAQETQSREVQEHEVLVPDFTVAEDSPEWQENLRECSVVKSIKKGKQRARLTFVTQAKRSDWLNKDPNIVSNVNTNLECERS